MKRKIEQVIAIPSGIQCSYESGVLSCRKDSAEISRIIKIPGISISVSGDSIIMKADEGSKNEGKIMASFIKHIDNIFHGLNNKFVYELESCNVHFPMTLKIEGENLAISNFLGEKVPRYAKILSGANVVIKGNMITIESHDKDIAGQTAANFEKATRVKKRDRRVFQDGIYITKKPGDKK